MMHSENAAAPSTILMCRNEEVLRFNSTKGELEILNEKLMPYPLRGQVTNVPDASYFEDRFVSIAEAANIISHNGNTFKSYIGNRVLNLTRSNAKYLLNSFNFSQSDDIDEKFKIALVCHGVSMSDSYWLKVEGSKETWKERNIRKVPLSKIVAAIALDGKVFTISGDPELTPEFLTKGAFAKAWMRDEDGFCYLRKRGLFGRELEPKREVEASNVMDCFDVSHVRYVLTQDELGYMSKCRCVAEDNRGLVDVSGLKSRYNRFDHGDFENFTDYVLAYDRENALKMVMMDFLCSNSDRHMENWGFYQNYDTGRLDGLYPLMDLNMCFDENIMNSKDGGYAGLCLIGRFPRLRQHLLLKMCSGSRQ